MEFSAYMHIAYLYGQEGSLELEWIRTTLQKEDWTSRLNRKYLTVETRMSPLWQLTASCCSKWGLVSSSGDLMLTPSETSSDSRQIGSNPVGSWTVPKQFPLGTNTAQVILAIASYCWREVRYCKEVSGRETQEFPHANEKGALKLETNTMWKFKGRDTVMSLFAHL